VTDRDGHEHRTARARAGQEALVGRQVTLFVSVDTEEDNWAPARDGVTVENIRNLPELDAFFRRTGVRATYFVTYQVATRPRAADTLRGIHARGEVEIGAHLHPWNTPPTPEPLLPRLTMTNNLPFPLQLAKIETLTESLKNTFGFSPRSFRAGRYGLNHDTVQALLRCGYRVDGSVTPTVNWQFCDDGPNFEASPFPCHWLPGGAEAPAGAELFEVPNSFGYSRRPFRRWGRIHSFLEAPLLGPIPLLGVATRLGVIRRIVLTPELTSARAMLVLSRRLLEEGVRHLQLFLHSPTLRPGLTPYTPSRADVDRLYACMEDYLEGLAKLADVRFATMSEAETLLGRDAAVESSVRSPSTQMA
jgi:peptidoglycan/xylan/chitin deacetylase (PgdA/CDA1 family)